MFIDLFLVASVRDAFNIRTQLPDPGLAAGRDNQSVAMSHLATEEKSRGLVASMPETPASTS